MIKDSTNPILAQRMQPLPTVILIHFEGALVLIDPVKRSDSSDDIEIDDQRANPKISIEREEAPTTSISALTSTLELTRASTFPPRPITTVLIRVPSNFL